METGEKRGRREALLVRCDSRVGTHERRERFHFGLRPSYYCLHTSWHCWQRAAASLGTPRVLHGRYADTLSLLQITAVLPSRDNGKNWHGVSLLTRSAIMAASRYTGRTRSEVCETFLWRDWRINLKKNCFWRKWHDRFVDGELSEDRWMVWKTGMTLWRAGRVVNVGQVDLWNDLLIAGWNYQVLDITVACKV